jgi:hypothetical protein
MKWIASAFLAAVSLFVSFTAVAQSWVDSGSTGVITMRKVGIGTTATPAESLTLQSGAVAFNHPQNTVPYVGIDYDPTLDALRLRANIGASALSYTWLVMKRANGFIGINTDNPGDRLSIRDGAMSFLNPTNPVPYVGFDYDAATDALRFRTNVGASILNRTAVSIDRATGAMTVAAAGSTGTKLNVNGNAVVTGNVVVTGSITGATVINAIFQDIAEWVPATTEMAAGTVVSLNRASANQVQPSDAAYDTTVAGVISAQPGIVLGVAGAGKVQVATTGRVKVRVTAAAAPIRIGDLLVTSGKPGLAMKSQPLSVGGAEFHRPGTLIGKALEDLPSGEGEILVLLSLQ